MKTSSKVVMLVVTYLILALDNILLASELVHDFKNPAFSGNGYSQHVLSINQLEVQREQKVFDDLKSAKAAADAASLLAVMLPLTISGVFHSLGI